MKTERTTKAKFKLGELQLAIMRAIWASGRASVAEVHEVLREDRKIAPTTVATMLVKMEKKGVVSHETEGRRFIYRAEVSEPQVRRSMVGELKQRLFNGDVPAFVSHLLDEHQLDAKELAELKRLIAEMEVE